VSPHDFDDKIFGMSGRHRGVQVYSAGKRAFELDFLRGFSVLLMIVHHTVFDLRFMFGVPGLDFEESFWMDDVLRPLFLMVFLGVSGISTSFSRNNARRGLRLLPVALAFTFATWILSRFFLPAYGVIYFNVLHVISLTTMFYALLVRGETDASREKYNARIIIASALIIFFGLTLPRVPELQGLRSFWLLPFGFLPAGIAVMDYMPLLPWSGIYLLGTLIGRGLYRDRQTRFPQVGRGTLNALSPVLFLGRHALIVYLVHQPVVYLVLSALQAAFGIFPGV